MLQYFLAFVACANVALCSEDKKFVIVTASYNNAKYYEKNLHSTLHQKYKQYRIIYIDDCSTDKTGKLVEAYLAQHNTNKVPVTFIKNRGRLGALHNIYFAVHQCSKDEIVVSVDGDDWLAHENVLSYLNKVYQDKNVWLTYCSYRRFSNGQIGGNGPYSQQVMKKRLYRWSDFRATHLRTFYAKLFHKISLEDLLHEDQFWMMGWDAAFMTPMLEMAGDKIKHILDVLYIYNDRNPISDGRVDPKQQLSFAALVKHKKKYVQLDSL